MKQFIQKIISSLENTPGGFSARKLSAFAVMICVIAAHCSWLKHAYQKEDFALLEGVLMIDFGFISVCLGMTTYETIQKNKQNPPA